MEPLRAILFGNSGSGKSSLARQLVAGRAVPILSLDDIAWNPGPERKPLLESVAALEEFIQTHDEWVVEGCYADLVEAALPFGRELRFLNPGIEVCVSHCQSRPWEPDKYPTPEAQEAMFDSLIEWVRAYETRDDECSYGRHRAVFDSHVGSKREYRLVADYMETVAEVSTGSSVSTGEGIVNQARGHSG